MRASSGKRRGGFILPTTLLVMTVLTVMLAAGFILVSAEYRVTDNSFASSRALAIAQAGLQNYFSAPHNLSGTPAETTYTFSGGYARVLALKLRDSVTVAPKALALWVVRSIGFDTVRAPVGQPNGQRAIAQFAEFQPGTLAARAAMTAANGVRMNAGQLWEVSNPITGVNFEFTGVPGGCSLPTRDDTTGVTTLSSGFAGTPNPIGGGALGGLEILGSASVVNDSTHIDWVKLLNGQFTPDFVNQLPPSGNNTYQAHYYTSDLTIPSGQRRGLLVVKGNVTLGRDSHWDGAIVAGGYVDGSGNFGYTVHGLVISGLNISLGQAVGPNQIRRMLSTGACSGTRVICWDWCYAHASIGSLGYLVPIKNTWVDNWSIY